MTPIILYLNLLTGATLTATGTESGYDVENILDQKTFTFWKAAAHGTNNLTADFGSAVAADTIGICGHNLYTVGATIYVEYSTDNSNWSEAAHVTPANNKALMLTFTAATKRYWRLRIVNSSGAPMIAVFYLGSKVAFEYPANTPQNIVDEGINAVEEMSKGGNFLGAVVNYKEGVLERTWIDFTRSWLVSYMDPFWDNHASQKKNFFYADDLSYASNICFYGRVPNDYRYTPAVERLDVIASFSLRMIATR